MSLNAGTLDATEGLALEIFQLLDDKLGQPLGATLEAEQLEKIRDSWRTLSFSIAMGVVEHLKRDSASDDFAETVSSSAQDAAFWSWLSGFAAVFGDWAANTGTLTSLRSSLNTFLGANPAPTQLRGVLE